MFRVGAASVLQLGLRFLVFCGKSVSRVRAVFSFPLYGGDGVAAAFLVVRCSESVFRGVGRYGDVAFFYVCFGDAAFFSLEVRFGPIGEFSWANKCLV